MREGEGWRWASRAKRVRELLSYSRELLKQMQAG
jgi:hypothetical protein